jgi:hypothetical protein
MFTNIVYVSSFFIVLFTLAFNNEYIKEGQVIELVIDCIMLLDILA